MNGAIHEGVVDDTGCVQLIQGLRAFDNLYVQGLWTVLES